jgi:hypothetical protein
MLGGRAEAHSAPSRCRSRKSKESSSRHKEKRIRDSHDSRISGKKYVCKRNIGMNIKSAQIASPVLGNTHSRRGRANAAR